MTGLFPNKDHVHVRLTITSSSLALQTAHSAERKAIISSKYQSNYINNVNFELERNKKGTNINELVIIINFYKGFVRKAWCSIA